MNPKFLNLLILACLLNDEVSCMFRYPLNNNLNRIPNMTTGFSVIPQSIPTTNRRVLSEAEMKAIADREFKRIQDEDEQSDDEESDGENFVTASEHEDEPAIFDYDSDANKKSVEPQAKYQPGAFGAFGILGNYGVTPLSNPMFLSDAFSHLPKNVDKNAVEDDQSQSASDVEDGDSSGNEEALKPGNTPDNSGPASLTRTVFDSIFGHHTPVVEHQVSGDEVIASENEEESDNESDSDNNILSYFKGLFVIPEAQQDSDDDHKLSDEEFLEQEDEDTESKNDLVDDGTPAAPAEPISDQDDTVQEEFSQADSDEEDTHEDNVQEVANSQDDSLQEESEKEGSVQEESEKDDSALTPGVSGEPNVELKDSVKENAEQEDSTQDNSVHEDTVQEDTERKDSVLDDLEFEQQQSNDDYLIASLSDSSSSHLQTKSEPFSRPLLNNVRRRKPTKKGWTDPAVHDERFIDAAMPKLDCDVDNGALNEEAVIAEVADDKQEAVYDIESAETETAETDSSLDNNDSEVIETVESKDNAPIIEMNNGGKRAKKRRNRKKKKTGKKKTDEKNSVVLESDEDVEDAEGSKELDDSIDSVDDHLKHPDFPVITPLGSDDGSITSTTLIDFDTEEHETDQIEELGKRLSKAIKIGKLGDVGLLHNVLLAQNVLDLKVPKIDVKAAADDDPIIDVDVKELVISDIEDFEKEQNIQSDPNTPPAVVSESEEEVTNFTQTEADNEEDIGTSNAEKLNAVIKASLAKPIRKPFRKPTVKRWTDPVYDVIIDDEPEINLVTDNEPGIQSIEDHEDHGVSDTTLDDGETDSDKDEESSNKEEEDDVLQTFQEESESEGNDEDSEHEKLDDEKDQTSSQEESEQSLTIEPSEGKRQSFSRPLRQSVRAPSRSKWEVKVDDESFKGTITSAVVDDSIESSNSADDEGSRKDDESIIEDSDPDISRSEIEKEDEEVETIDESELVKDDLIDSHLATAKTVKKEDLREPSLSTEKEFEANSEEKKVPLTINEEKKDPLFVATSEMDSQVKVPEPSVSTNIKDQSNGTSGSTVLLETTKKSSWNYALIGSVAGLAVLSVAGYFGFRYYQQMQEESVEL